MRLYTDFDRDLLDGFLCFLTAAAIVAALTYATVALCR